MIVALNSYEILNANKPLLQQLTEYFARGATVEECIALVESAPVVSTAK